MRLRVPAAIVTVALVVLAGCGDDDDDAAEETTTTTVDLAALYEQVCDDGQTYMVALDDYGALLSGDETTVGDVTEGATELATAEADLELAVDELTEGVESTDTSLAITDGVSIDRVKKAQGDFEDATTDVNPDTALVDAALEVSAAAYQLQVAWGLLLVDAGCVDDPDAVQANAASFTIGLEQDLAAAGRYDGEIDGIYGPLVIEGVQGLQADHGLPVTGLPDRATAAALAEELENQELAQVAALQSMLAAAGFYTGPVDGIWSTEVSDAVAAFQAEQDLDPTGEIDPETLQALVIVIGEITTPSSTTAAPTTTAAPAPTTTGAPATTAVPETTTAP
jgi:peptidoglycan hydrolase-like protein with peptidoglycan-binding domain